MTRRLERALAFLRRGDGALYMIVAITTIVVTVFALELFRMTWAIPLEYSGDAILISAHVKTDLARGWYESEPLLGAPWGQVYHDWKSADNLHHAIVSLLRPVVGDWAVGINLYYLLGYLFAALTATWFLRRVGVSRIFSAPLGVLYAIAPYHFIRGENHMWLSEYWPIPLALGVVYAIARGRPAWGRHPDRPGWRGLVTGPGAITLFAVALVCTANSYYGFWTILLIALAGLLRLIADRDWRRFLGAVVAGAWGVVVMLLNMVPDILYSLANGSNPRAVVRFPVEGELYALKFVQLILPQAEHRVTVLRQLRSVYDQIFPFPAENPALGIIAAFGFVAAFAFTLYLLVARIGRGAPRAWGERTTAFGAISALILFGFLLSTLGGLASVVAMFTSDLRGWNRMSILIAMLALAATGLILDGLRVRIAAARRSTDLVRTGVSALAALAVLGVGYLDQVTPARVPDYAGVQAAFEADADLVDRIEAAVPEDGMILQLPHRDFPESPGPTWDTDQLKPFLHSDTLSWSGGAIKGRATSEWSRIAQVLPESQLALAAAAAGFDGVLVDRAEYETAQDASAAFRLLDPAFGTPAFTAQDGRYRFYSLASTRTALDSVTTAGEREGIGTALVEPVFASFSPDYSRGFSVPETLRSYVPEIRLDNARDVAVAVDLKFDVSYVQGPATLRFTLPDGTETDIRVGVDMRTVTLAVTAPAGRSVISVVVADGPAPVKGATSSGPIVVGEILTYDRELARLLGDAVAALVPGAAPAAG